jgi:hypothetical protein
VSSVSSSAQGQSHEPSFVEGRTSAVHVTRCLASRPRSSGHSSGLPSIDSMLPDGPRPLAVSAPKPSKLQPGPCSLLRSVAVASSSGLSLVAAGFGLVFAGFPHRYG